jgi:hypothetical protein
VKLSGTMPDVTPAQTAAVAGWVGSQAVAYGWLDIRYQQVVLSAGGTVLFAAWKIADAVIRNGRARALAANPGLTTVVPPAAK